MLVVKTYINKILGDLPNKRITNERAEEFMKGNIRNDDNPNDSLAKKVLAKLNKQAK